MTALQYLADHLDPRVAVEVPVANADALHLLADAIGRGVQELDGRYLVCADVDGTPAVFWATA